VDSRADTLESHVLAVFERALQEGRYEIADHLLRALEASSDAMDDLPPNGSVAVAYGRLAGAMARLNLPDMETGPIGTMPQVMEIMVGRDGCETRPWRGAEMDP
jgi:hypothetical protein